MGKRARIIVDRRPAAEPMEKWARVLVITLGAVTTATALYALMIPLDLSQFAPQATGGAPHLVTVPQPGTTIWLVVAMGLACILYGANGFRFRRVAFGEKFSIDTEGQPSPAGQELHRYVEAEVAFEKPL